MYNYFPEFFWLVDKILLVALIAFAIFINFYTVVKDYFENGRKRKLLYIRKNLQNLALSGEMGMRDTCPAIVGQLTPKQFLDVISEREFILPKELESQLRECFIASGKVAEIEHIVARSKNKWLKIQAIVSLGYTKSDNAAVLLKDSLNNKDEDISYFSMLALGQLKNKTAAKILLSFIAKRRFSGYRIVSLLEQFPNSITEELLNAIKSTDKATKFWAINLIAKFKPKNAVKRIEELCLDKSDEVRSAACECLGKLEAKDARQILIKALKDNSWVVRMGAVRALTQIFGKEAIGEIAPLIDDNAWSVRDSVKKAFTYYIREALPYLEAHMCDKQEGCKIDCAETFEEAGYFEVLFEDILSGDANAKAKAVSLLKCIIKSGIHFGIEAVLSAFEKNAYEKLLQEISNIDTALAEHIDKKVKRQIVEI